MIHALDATCFGLTFLDENTRIPAERNTMRFGRATGSGLSTNQEDLVLNMSLLLVWIQGSG